MLLCMHVPAFALAVARLAQPPVSDDDPVLLADKNDRGRVLELNDRAHVLGARIGQTIVQACAAVGGAHVLLHDAARSRTMWQDMLDALDTVSPLVDDAQEGTAFLEMRGIDGDPPDWMRRTHRAIDPFQLSARVAAGPNKFVSCVATYAGDGTICEPDHVQQLLAPMPLERLGVDTGTIERLRLLGVTTLGELAALPHGSFVRRFGRQAAEWHERARGVDRTPLRPRPHELQIDAASYGEGSATQAEQIYFALRVLAEQVCTDLGRAGRSAAALQATFQCEDGDVRPIDAVLAQPTADPRTMLAVLRAKIEGITFTAPVDGIRLQAVRLEEGGTSTTFFAGQEADPQEVGVALARLEAALGAATQHATTRPGHRLETRFAFTPFSPRAATGAPPVRPRIRPIPQLRLLKVRQLAVRVRSNAPASVDGRAVVKAAGPWRVDDGWFDAPVARDEYDVLLEDGMLLRIYRQGERWYLRGAYD